MPTKVPKQGTRRSGQGVAVPAGGSSRPVFGNHRPPFLHGNVGSPSSSGDETRSQQSQRGYGEDETYHGGDDTIDLPGEDEQNKNLPPQKVNYNMGPGSINVGESLLRASIRSMLNEEASDEEIDDDTIDEFSAIGGAPGAGGAITGYTLPLGSSNSNKSKKKKK